MNYFIDDVIPDDWDGEIKLSTINGKVDWRKLTAELPCGDGVIEVGFRFNGASVGVMRSFLFFGFPKWKHPIATCRHDKRCNEAHKYKLSGDKKTYKRLRAIADDMFKKDVGVGGTKWEQFKGYAGVRVGAFF